MLHKLCFVYIFSSIQSVKTQPHNFKLIVCQNECFKSTWNNGWPRISPAPFWRMFRRSARTNLKGRSLYKTFPHFLTNTVTLSIRFWTINQFKSSPSTLSSTILLFDLAVATGQSAWIWCSGFKITVGSKLQGCQPSLLPILDQASTLPFIHSVFSEYYNYIIGCLFKF